MTTIYGEPKMRGTIIRDPSIIRPPPSTAARRPNIPRHPPTAVRYPTIIRPSTGAKRSTIIRPPEVVRRSTIPRPTLSAIIDEKKASVFEEPVIVPESGQQPMELDEDMFESKQTPDPYTAIASHFLTRHPCDLSSQITIEKVFKPDTASGSLVTKGVVNIAGLEPRPVIVKINIPKINSSDNSLDVERQIYSTVINNLLVNHNTPCLTRYLGHYTCGRNEVKFADSKQQGLYNDFITDIERNSRNPVTDVNILITQFGGTESLASSKFSSYDVHTQVKIIFMIMQTLNCFNRIGFRHNDLHSGNILLDILPSPVTVKYEYKPAKYIEFQTNIIPRIFDFDRASISYPGIERNVFLDMDMCASVGSCNSFSDRADFFSFMYDINSKLSRTDGLDRRTIDRNKDLATLINSISKYPEVAHENTKYSDWQIVLSQKAVLFAEGTMPRISSFMIEFVKKVGSILGFTSDGSGAFRFPPYRSIKLENPVSYSATNAPLAITVQSMPITAADFSKSIIDMIDSEMVRLFNYITSTYARHHAVPGNKIKPDVGKVFRSWFVDTDNMRYNSNAKIVKIDYNFKKSCISLAHETFKLKGIKNLPTQYLRFYVDCFLVMSLPFFQNIPAHIVVREIADANGGAVTETGISKIIGDIWNVNKNILPFKIPLLK
jgi:hypothetical protein